MQQAKKLYFVRHAQSQFNLAQMIALKTTNEVRVNEDVTVKFDPALIDCTISELGVEQAQGAGEKLKDVDIGLVVTSPLRRCLETTRVIFQNHKDKPKIIVWPILKEMLLSSCDVHDDIDTIKKEYPSFDFSLIDEYPHPELWLLYVLKNEQLRDELIAELFSEYPTKEEALKNVRYFLTKKVKENYPNRIETQMEVNERTVRSKDVIKNQLNELPDGKSLVIVAHSRFLEAFTAESFGEKGEPINAKWFHNGEVASIDLE